MAIRFGDAVNAFAQGQEIRRKRQDDRLDSATKLAALQESGFNWDGNTLTPTAGYQSLKALQRKKLENEMDPSFAASQAGAKEKAILEARRSFGGETTPGNGPNMNDQFVMDPAGHYHDNPYTKPLSDTASTRMSAAEQALGNLKTVRGMATPEKFGDLKKGFTKIRLGNRLGVTNPESIQGALINGFGGAAHMVTGGLIPKPIDTFKTTDEQKQFENNLSTLVEGQLRARTGAAAPQTEVDREVSRILASDDSLDSFLAKLSNAEKFTVGIAEGIRPGSSKRFGQQPRFGEPTQPEPPVQSGAYIDRAAALASGYSEEELQSIAQSKGLAIK